ncbi:hypothetical protein WI93_00590 [Burkholderia vietnamiensis]|nr:hypothetical protein WI93_00590 [Burkholderia vietnamiensis]TPQ42656.1 hypothetical protein C2U71_19840 [Burkholderia ubonensis]KVE62671.1 hypothetical protein WI97_21285 [Burkholderia vietnamiensis]KVF12128.1 hypothetical protein WJ05_01670 [Burkholderia vietnamiensis]KVF28601.1 hypothetical protein WJ08_23125 [Burkholderia vietnamiensis]
MTSDPRVCVARSSFSAIASVVEPARCSVLDASGAVDVDSAFVEVVESVELGNVIAHRRGLRI